MDKNRDDIIRKLFERSLEPKERGELNNYEFINDALRKQWEEAPAIVDSVREERILHSVLKNVKRKTNYFTYSFYRSLNPQLHSRSATYKRNGLLIRKTAIKSSRPFQCAYYPLTP